MTTTPGGTTIEAIYQIEQSQIRPAMIRAIEEATKKSQAIREKLKPQIAKSQCLKQLSSTGTEPSLTHEKQL